MLKAILHDNPNESWEEVLPWGLFAYREVPVQGLGFSAFDLMFGRSVKGSLHLIRSQWLNDDWVNDLKKQNFIDFVLNLRERVHGSLQAANACAVNEKLKSKQYYDLKSRVVEFEEGDLELVLLPLICTLLWSIQGCAKVE